MPKQNDVEQKPIYIPRNVYVPVIRPVFVPRERIIVKPQIIHVARPVLVDRPVPVQQKPIVIERDRPVPIRVETVEKVENIETTLHRSGSNQYDIEYEVDNQPEEGIKYGYSYGEIPDTKVEEPTYEYHYESKVEQPRTFEYQYETKVEQPTTFEYQYETKVEQPKTNEFQSVEEKLYNFATLDLNKYYQDPDIKFVNTQNEVVTVAASTETHAQSNNNVSNILKDMLTLHEQQTTRTTVPSYTLEVFDSTVSDKFEKVDPSSLKNYVIDAYPYNNATQTNVTTTYTQESYVGGSSVYRNDSFKSISEELEQLKSRSAVFPESVGRIRIDD